MSLHLATCRDCAAEAETTLNLRKAMRQIPSRPMPPQLASELRVLASHERARLLTRLSWSARVRAWADRASLMVDNLMRPLALPLAGGLMSALFLFAVLVPTFGFRHVSLANDVPIPLFTEATLEETGPLALMDDETVVEVSIDDRGQVTGYSIQEGTDSRLVEASLANALLLSKWAPATWFGQPTSGKVMISFRRSHIVVKG